MKAKLYQFENQFEVRVSNKVYSSVEKESKKDFQARVAVELEKDFDEAIDIVEVSNKTFEKLNNNLLIEAYKVSKGLQETIIKSIMATRGLEFEKIEKEARAKVQVRDREEMKASPEYLEAKANVGKLASFVPAKSEEIVEGVVKSISLNKSNTIIYYNVKCGSSLKCCTAKNTSLVFYEI